MQAQRADTSSAKVHTTHCLVSEGLISPRPPGAATRAPPSLRCSDNPKLGSIESPLGYEATTLVHLNGGLGSQ